MSQKYMYGMLHSGQWFVARLELVMTDAESGNSEGEEPITAFVISSARLLVLTPDVHNNRVAIHLIPMNPVDPDGELVLDISSCLALQKEFDTVPNGLLNAYIESVTQLVVPKAMN